MKYSWNDYEPCANLPLVSSQFTLLEALVLVSIAVGQVMYLKKFLEKTAYL
jgi:hypothetical protein